MHITPCRIAEQDKESHCPSVGRIRRARAACNFGPPAPLASARDESVKTLKTRTERLNKPFTKHFNKRTAFSREREKRKKFKPGAASGHE